RNRRSSLPLAPFLSAMSLLLIVAASLARRRLLLHRHLGLEAGDVPEDRGDGERATALLVAHQAVLARNITLDRHFVPGLGVADIVDRDVVMLAPKEWYGLELFAPAQHIQRGRLPLTLGDDPMFDADALPRVRIGPARDVAGAIDVGRARLQVTVDREAAV